MIARYDMASRDNNGEIEYIPELCDDPHGYWVLYDDHVEEVSILDATLVALTNEKEQDIHRAVVAEDKLKYVLDEMKRMRDSTHVSAVVMRGWIDNCIDRLEKKNV